MSVSVSVSVDSVDEARAKMGASVEPLGCEPVELRAALNRTLREAPSAARDQPPFASSAMDGFAVRAADLRSGRLTVIGESAAGRPYAGAIAAGEAVRIFTGAPVPLGVSTATVAYMPGRIRPSFFISTSTRSVRVPGSMLWLVRAIVPV